MARINVMPKNVRPGDKVDQLDKDTMDFTPVAVTSVEKVRMANRTAYRVHLAEGPAFVLNPGHPITVDREES